MQLDFFKPDFYPLQPYPVDKKVWMRLYGNIKTSATNGSTGGQTSKILKDAGFTRKQVLEIYSKKGHYLDPNLTWLDLRKIFWEVQDGRCYWTGIKMNPNWIFTAKKEPYHHQPALALSADRKHNGKEKKHGYIFHNIAICCRGLNHMRQHTPHDNFPDVLRRFNMPVHERFC